MSHVPGRSAEGSKPEDAQSEHLRVCCGFTGLFSRYSSCSSSGTRDTRRRESGCDSRYRADPTPNGAVGTWHCPSGGIESQEHLDEGWTSTGIASENHGLRHAPALQ